MINLAEKQRQRAIADRKTFLVNELYKMGIYDVKNGEDIANLKLVELEQIYINERCRALSDYP